MSEHARGLVKEVNGGMETYRCPECAESVLHIAEDVESSPCLLHAAAPTMLGVLERLVDPRRRRSKFDRAADLYDARVAIAKARGQA